MRTRLRQLGSRIRSARARIDAALRSALGDGGEALGQGLREVDDVLRELEEISDSRGTDDEHYALLAERSTDLITRTTPDAVFLYLSPACGTLWGYAPEDLLGRCAFDLVDPRDLDVVHEAAARVRNSTEPVTVQCRTRRRDGAEVWCEAAIRAVRDDATGRATELVSIVRDVTERKHAEERLRESEERFRCLVEQAADAIFVSDLDGRLIDVNRRACETLGYAREELLRLTVADVETHLDRDDFPQMLRYLLPGTPVMMEGRQRRKDGTTLPVEVRFGAFCSGDRTLVLALVRDITDRRRAEEDLRESEERFRLMAETIPEMLWITDPVAHRVLYISPAYREITGRTCESAYERPESPLDAVHPDDRDRVLRVYQQRSSESFDEQYRVVRPDGEVRWVRSRAFPVRDREGRIRRVVGFTEDVTRWRDAEEDLARARDAALESARLKSAFLANMSHEIRTPLNVILGYSSILAEHLAGLGDSSQRGVLEGVERAGRRLMDTIHAILDLSRIEIGSFEVRPAMLSLPALVEKYVHEVARQAAAKGLMLSWQREIEPGDGAIVFDEYCLSQAVRHLLHNAIKFTESGAVLVRLYRDEEGLLCLAVRDTGVGIHTGYVARLFEPFSQEQSGYTRRFDGSGLGLALTREYLRLNGAGILVRSEKGKGSTFTIRFGASSAARPKPTGNGESADRPVVLVVEDDPETQTYMTTLLAHRYRVLVAASGEEVMRHLEGNAGKVSMVLMDLALKGEEDGLRITRDLRSRQEWRDLPIIATTAHVLPDDRVKALAAGCNAYIAKPLDHRELFSAMEKCLPVVH